MKSPTAPIPELDSRTWAELEVLPHPTEGTLLFKDKIRKRNAKGKFEDEPVRVRIVRPLQIAQARADCRQWFATLKGLDPDRDKDVFDNLEQLCILEHAIRQFNAPYGQLATKEELATDYEEASLWDLKGRIEAMRFLMDPREADLGPDEIWGKISQIAAKGNLLPLADIAGHAQASFIVFMARQAMTSPTAVCWLQSLGISTPEPSTSKPSDPSSKEAE
jgi:hypothetical protein